MANGTTVQQNSGPVAKRPDQRTIHSIGSSLQMLGERAVGVLSRTVIPSTTIRWILPARIRHKDHNDVIFVGESFVQLREFLPSRHLADMPARLEMGCRILAAKVISHVEVTSFVDQVVKQEQHEDDSKSTLPPQTLVLALDFGELAFVYAEDVAPGQIEFRVGRKKLPADVSALGQYGRHLAVDSKSRAMAIAPAHGQVGLLRLNTVPEIYGQIAAFDAGRPEAFSPLKEERYVQVDGLILRMDFLVSPSNEQAKIILALLVSKNQATHMLLYSWEEKAPVRYAKLEASRRLPDGDRMPLMMIPSNQNASFTLVTESGITVYDDILSPTYRCINLQLPQSFPEKFVGSCRSPLWAQWAKPYRHSGYLETNDDIFLVREDGELIYLEIKYKETTKVSTQSAVDSLHINVDSAFAILEGPLDQGGDICVAGGDMSDGTVCHIKARAALERFQTIRNFAPIRDMLILDATSHNEDAKRIFVCSGKGDKHAAVSEIRRGLEARIGFFADQEDSSMASGLWFVPEDVSNQITLLASYPSQTSALRIVFRKETTDNESGENGESGDKTTFETADDDLANQGFQMSSQTLAFAGTKGGLLVQITTSAVTVLSPLSKTGAVDRRHAVHPVLNATLHHDDLLFATIALVNDGFQVLLGSIDVSDATVSINDYCEPYSMVEEPSSIAITNISGLQLLIIGTIDGSIHVLKIEPGQGLRLLSQYSLAKLYPHIEQSAICSLAVLTDAALTPSTVACGTRNGWLLGLNIVPGLRGVRQGEGDPSYFKPEEVDDLPHALTLQPESAQHIGHTSVKLIPDSESRSAALLFCDIEVHRITYPQTEPVVGFQVSRIWFSDVNQPELHQPQISAVAALCKHVSSGMSELEATFFCLSRNELFVSSLSLQPSIVPRKLLVDGDPSKLVFAKELGKLVVVIDQTMLIPDASPRRPARRVVRPGIQFLDPDPCDATSGRKQVELLGQAGSRITSLLSWTPTNGTKRLQMIVVGLYVDGPDTAHCDGRIIYLTARQNGRQNCDLDIDTIHTIRLVGSPIYSLAEYGLSSLVVCAGTDLFLQSLDISTGTWVRGASYTLPSPAVSLHVSGQLIYATTARHSLKIFDVEDGQLTLRAKETQTREAMREVTQFVGNDEGGMLAISTNKGGRVRGLSRQPDGEVTCLFEARLPLIVNCLRESYTGDSIHHAGKKYYGSTQDGGLYQFTILSQQEWEFLDFIAKIARKTPAPQFNVKRKSSSLQRRERKKVRPTEMHVRGDQIIDILRNGPNELRRLIEEASPSSLPGQESRSPDQRLRQLSALGEPLFGTSEDTVLAAARWMEKLVSDTLEG